MITTLRPVISNREVFCSCRVAAVDRWNAEEQSAVSRPFPNCRWTPSSWGAPRSHAYGFWQPVSNRHDYCYYVCYYMESRRRNGQIWMATGRCTSVINVTNEIDGNWNCGEVRGVLTLVRTNLLGVHLNHATKAKMCFSILGQKWFLVELQSTDILKLLGHSREKI